MNLDERQQIINDEHLKLLRIAYLIQGSVTAMMVFIGILYLGIGMFFSAILGNLAETGNSDMEGMEFVGAIYSVIGFAIIVFVAIASTLYFMSAHYINKRRNRIFVLVAAGLSCLNIPWGTAIGVCTFYVLNRPEVKDEFDGITKPTIEWTPSAGGSDEMPPIPPPPSRS